MKIEYNEVERTIYIKDDLNNHYFMMKSLIVLNLINAILRLLNLEETGVGLQEILWFIIGAVSLITLYFFLYKKTTAEKFNIHEIKRIKKRSFLGRNKYYLELVNGTQRDLPGFKNEQELADLKSLLAEN
jgi:hypothetical protein